MDKNMTKNSLKEQSLEYALDAIKELKYACKTFHKGSIEKAYMRAEALANEVNWEEISDKIKKEYDEALKKTKSHYKDLF